MRVYIDDNGVCHATQKDGYTEVEIPFFDRVPKEACECYKYDVTSGLIKCIDTKTAMGIRRQFESDDRTIKDLVTYLPDDAALERTTLFPEWESGTEYVTDYRVQYNGLLYRCVQAHTAQSNWTPDNTPALWARVSVDEYPEWIQPTGAQDAYKAGDKVTHADKRWISTINNNTWEPGIYGWEEVK